MQLPSPVPNYHRFHCPKMYIQKAVFCLAEESQTEKRALEEEEAADKEEKSPTKKTKTEETTEKAEETSESA